MNPNVVANRLEEVFACASQSSFCPCGLVINYNGLIILEGLLNHARRIQEPRLSAKDELRAALDERDALLELKANIQKRKHAEEKVTNARRRSEVVAAELAAEKAELARLKALKAMRNRLNSLKTEPCQEKSHNYNLRNRPWVNYKC